MPELTEQEKIEQQNERQKQYDQMVFLAMKTVAAAMSCDSAQIHTHLFYGETAVDPGKLVAWYVFKTDKCMEQARRSGIAHRIVGLTRKELIRNGYPVKAVSKARIDFASDEDIQNKTDGNYWKYFQ
jgi:hypothetical protein